MSDPLVTRHNGWTPRRQLAFLDTLSVTGSFAAAAAAAGMAREGAYGFRRRHPDSLFSLLWADCERVAKVTPKGSRR